MIDRVALKARAKEFAFNNKWNFWKAILLNGLILGAASTVSDSLSKMITGTNESWIASLLALIVELAALPLSVGLLDYFINLVRGNKDLDLTKSLFKYYHKEYIWNVIKILLVANIIVFLLSLCLVIPGIIWALKYAMIGYIIVDKKPKDLEKSNIRMESTELMNGHKWEFVVFNLSFILWYLLGMITLGIAYIWVIPYVQTSQVMYYEELKKLSK